MPTKEELTNELAEAKGRIAEMEGDEGVRLRERIVPIVGMDAWEAAERQAVEEAGVDGDDLSATEWDDLTLHVLLRPPATNDAEVAEGETHEVAALRADLQRVEIERDSARNEAARLRAKVKDMSTLHGSVDSLPSVVG